MEIGPRSSPRGAAAEDAEQVSPEVRFRCALPLANRRIDEHQVFPHERLIAQVTKPHGIEFTKSRGLLGCFRKPTAISRGQFSTDEPRLFHATPAFHFGAEPPELAAVTLTTLFENLGSMCDGSTLEGGGGMME